MRTSTLHACTQSTHQRLASLPLGQGGGGAGGARNRGSMTEDYVDLLHLPLAHGRLWFECLRLHACQCCAACFAKSSLAQRAAAQSSLQ